MSNPLDSFNPEKAKCSDCKKYFDKSDLVPLTWKSDGESWLVWHPPQGINRYDCWSQVCMCLDCLRNSRHDIRRG